MLKKIISIIVALTLLLGLTAVTADAATEPSGNIFVFEGETLTFAQGDWNEVEYSSSAFTASIHDGVLDITGVTSAGPDNYYWVTLKKNGQYSTGFNVVVIPVQEVEAEAGDTVTVKREDVSWTSELPALQTDSEFTPNVTIDYSTNLYSIVVPTTVSAGEKAVLDFKNSGAPKKRVIIKIKGIPEEETYDITVSDDGNGTAEADPTTAAAGATVTLSATPNDGYQFKEWNVISGDIEIVNDSFTMPESDVEIEALFEAIKYDITVTDDGNGTAEADATTAAAGTTVTLSATPDDGYQFKEWNVISGDIEIVDDSFTMPQSDVEIEALFEAIEYNVTVSDDGNGTAQADPTTATAGTTVTLSATPNAGYKFKEWNVISGDISIENDTFTMPQSDVEIVALFEAIEYNVTVSDDGNGTAKADPTAATAGTTVTLTATPNEGYQFKEWKVISGDITIEDNTFTMPQGDVEVEAVFVKKESSPSNDKPDKPGKDEPAAPEKDTPVTPAKDSPKTGDEANVYIWSVCLLLSMVSIVWLNRRRRTA